MPDKPRTASGYPPEQTSLVRATCLYVATKLGDLMADLVVVGGLVPSLLIDQNDLPEGADPHVGTLDLDVGLSLGLLDHGRYQMLGERLRGAGFAPDTNEAGNLTRQRWKIESGGVVTVEFLIPPSLPDDSGGRLRNIEPDLAAVVLPGLELAFTDRERITLSGRTINDEYATRDLWVCGPGAFIVLKALAFRSRGENKDAYDLYYMVRNFGSGTSEVGARLKLLSGDPSTKSALEIIRQDFLDHDGLGPRRVAEFLALGPDDAVQADVAGFLDELVRLVAS